MEVNLNLNDEKGLYMFIKNLKDSGFWGELTLTLNAGKVVHIVKKESIKVA